jgi:DNA anti-recombination protein RmuC
LKICGNAIKTKDEVEKLQEKFTKKFENLANKILDEKSNKFTEQNKENMKKYLVSFARQDSVI